MVAGAAALLAAPAVLAFRSGGYFDVPRLWAALAMWVGVSAIALLAPQRLPVSRPALCALGGLLAFAALAFASAWWAPRRGPAFDDAGRDLLYLGALIAAAALLRGPVARAAEPALAAGATIVIGYGLSERLAPGLVTLSHSRTAFGRLEQPLTYWNATGALAAIGLVLALRLAGDPERRAGLRSAAIAAAVPLGAGLALSYSRGALLAAVAGLVVLVALAPETIWTAALGAGAALLAGVAVSIPDGVRTLAGDTSAQGAVVLVVLLVLMGAAVLALRRVRPARGLRIGGVAAAAIVAGLVGLVLLRRGAGPRRRAARGRPRARPRSGWPPRSPTATPTGAWPCAASRAIPCAGSAAAGSPTCGCTSARCATRRATRTRSTSRRRRSTGCSGWPASAWCSAVSRSPRGGRGGGLRR